MYKHRKCCNDSFLYLHFHISFGPISISTCWCPVSVSSASCVSSVVAILSQAPLLLLLCGGNTTTPILNSTFQSRVWIRVAKLAPLKSLSTYFVYKNEIYMVNKMVFCSGLRATYIALTLSHTVCDNIFYTFVHRASFFLHSTHKWILRLQWNAVEQQISNSNNNEKHLAMCWTTQPVTMWTCA